MRDWLQSREWNKNVWIHVDINEQIGSLIKNESLHTLNGPLHTILINYKVKKRVTLQWRRLRRLIREKTEQINQVSQEWDKGSYRLSPPDTECSKNHHFWDLLAKDADGSGGTRSCLTLCDPRTAARQAPLSTGLPRQEDWSGLPFPPPGDLPDPRIEPLSPTSPAKIKTDYSLLHVWDYFKIKRKC